MKIRSLQLNNFRKFDRPIVIRGFGDGVNVLAERNEFGKSTILAALNGVVFERYKANTKEVREFQNTRSPGVPEVTLEFELAGGRHVLHKRFAQGSGRALLTMPGGQKFMDEAAEKRLQELLGLSTAGRSIEPGIWGTLWVKQGQSFGRPDLDPSSMRTIQDCLEREVGVVTGGRRGQKIPAAIDEALGQLTTASGKPRGHYKVAIERRGEVVARIEEFTTKRAQLDQWLETLAQKKQDLARRKASNTEQEIDEKLRLASDDRIRVATHALEIKREAEALAYAESLVGQARKELNERSRLAQLLEVRRAELSVLNAALIEHEKRLRDLDERVTATRMDLEQLREEERLSEDAGRRWRRIKEAARTKALIDGNRKHLHQAQQVEREMEESAAKQNAITITDKIFRAIEQAERKLTSSEAALQAVATFVDLALIERAIDRVTVDGKGLEAGTSTLRLLSDATMEIKGVGTIRVRPQVQDRETLVENHERAIRELRRHLADARCESVAAVRDEMARRKELEKQHEIGKRHLSTLLPGDDAIDLLPGIAPLRQWIATQFARFEAEMRALDLETPPAPAAIELAISNAERDLDEIKGKIRSVDKALKGQIKTRDDAALAVARQQATCKTTDAEIEKDATGLRVARQQRDDERLRQEFADRQREVDVARNALQAKRLGEHESVEDVDTRIERHKEALAQHRKTNQKLADEINGFTIRVEENQGAGLDEKLEAARAEDKRLEDAIAAMQQDVEVLQLLSETLHEAERTARERYLAPVLKRVKPYLSMLLPQAHVVMSDDFQVATIERGPLSEEFGRLSDGTREQIAVLTRLAFAEMLLAQGKPAMVILDDALVYSDDERMERMLEILRRAGKHTQVLVLSCRERVFERLGGTLLHVEELSEASALGASG